MRAEFRYMEGRNIGMRITKKIASEIFKKVVGTDKGMEKFQRGIEDIWVIKLGVITTILRDELKYDLFGNRVEGKHWIVYIDTKYGEDIRVYIDKQTLKIDDFYTQEKLQEREESRREEYKEVMET